MPFTKSFRRLSRLSLTALVLLTTGSALARPDIPGQLQEAADMQCVPLCTMCHQTNPGEATNWTMKPMGIALSTPIVARTDIKPRYNEWASMNPALAAMVKKGIEPGSGADVCGPTYGCAVHIAKEAAAPHDFTAPLLALGAMIAGGILRRRRKPSAN